MRGKRTSSRFAVATQLLLLLLETMLAKEAKTMAHSAVEIT